MDSEQHVDIVLKAHTGIGLSEASDNVTCKHAQACGLGSALSHESLSIGCVRRPVDQAPDLPNTFGMFFVVDR